MLYNKGNHAKFKCVQPQPSPLQDENGGKIHQTWNFGSTKVWPLSQNKAPEVILQWTGVETESG